MNSNDCLSEAQTFLSKHQTSGQILFSSVTGSRAYNLSSPDSDIDYLGVYLFETKEFLELGHQLPKDPLNTLPYEVEDVDFMLYEARQFVRLLAQGYLF